MKYLVIINNNNFKNNNNISLKLCIYIFIHSVYTVEVIQSLNTTFLLFNKKIQRKNNKIQMQKIIKPNG